MESTIIRKVKGSDMEYIFDNMSGFVNIKYYKRHTPHHLMYDPSKTYWYNITIRHPEGTDAQQLFTDALNIFVEQKQETITEIQALQNAANDLNLTIYEKQTQDKRKTVKLYFANRGNETVSPNLDYENLNHFLLGWRNCVKSINKAKN